MLPDETARRVERYRYEGKPEGNFGGMSMSKLLATASAIGIAAMIALPSLASARPATDPGMKTSNSIEVSSVRRAHHRYYRHYGYRHSYGPRYGYYRGYNSYAYDPYYNGYGYGGPYYARPGVSVGVGPFGFGFGF